MKDNKLAKIIIGEINKVAYGGRPSSGIHQETTTIDIEDVELTIDGKKKICDITLEVYVSFHWWSDPGDYWQPPEGDIDKVEYDIQKISIGDKDGTIYTKEQESKILDENYKYLHDYIEEEVEEAIEDMDTSEDNDWHDED